MTSEYYAYSGLRRHPREPRSIIIDNTDHLDFFPATRRVPLPSSLNRGDARPFSLVMNFGSMSLDDRERDLEQHYTHVDSLEPPPLPLSSSYSRRLRGGGSNTTDPDRDGFPSSSSSAVRGTTARRVGMCLGCFKRQIVAVASGYCLECDLFASPAALPVRERGLPASLGGVGGGGGMYFESSSLPPAGGVRYVTGGGGGVGGGRREELLALKRELRERELRELERIRAARVREWERDRVERERRLGGLGYYSEDELDLF
ncbi:hypothetical protein B0T19DRAFT_440998 [Cercophora scortea]|uniref:Uncharacterized protein n=1 Tax=Cercophora scortea TaxID=314031 RepID=A0AAE0MCB4_9PEZI|nr:hypothetical protein B0T19DRAFT_440998 [Cercophora scortea]